MFSEGFCINIFIWIKHTKKSQKGYLNIGLCLEISLLVGNNSLHLMGVRHLVLEKDNNHGLWPRLLGLSKPLKSLFLNFHHFPLQKVHLRKLQQQVTFLGLMLGVSLAGFISDRWKIVTMMKVMISIGFWYFILNMKHWNGNLYDGCRNTFTSLQIKKTIV